MGILDLERPYEISDHESLARILVSASEPPDNSVYIGCMWFDTANSLLKICTANNLATGSRIWTSIGTFTGSSSPSAHATSHESGGADPIQLDDLAAPSDNTDLDASLSTHGLLKKLPGTTTTFLRGDGTFATLQSATWTLVGTGSLTSGTTLPFTDLSAYTDIRVFITGVTFITSASQAELQVSTDNGSSYLTSSGDYKSVSGNGAIFDQTSLRFYDAAHTSLTRAGHIQILGFNSTAPKLCLSSFFGTDSVLLRYIPTASALNALQIMRNGTGTFSAGSVYVFGR